MAGRGLRIEPSKVFRRRRSAGKGADIARVFRRPHPSTHILTTLSTIGTLLVTLLMGVALVACGPHVHIPPQPAVVPSAVAANDPGAVLARELAPTLYLQPNETFPLTRVVAVIHPTRRVIGYYLLWRHDVMGRWSPFSKGTDEEEMWVGYDSTGAPTDLWTYWHGVILHTSWRGKGQVLADVQWGKHGSLPHGVRLADLPPFRRMTFFYALTWAFPDLWLGRLSSPGPLCFCHSFSTYIQFTQPLPLAPRLNAIARTAQPDSVLTAVFGKSYARKRWWP